MFTVSNRDVILQISIAAFFCVFLFPRTIYSQEDERIKGEIDSSYSNNNVTYDSYENYLSSRKDGSFSTSSVIQKKVSEKMKRPLQTEKQTPYKNKKNVKYTFYKVRKGDTLTSIAMKNNVSISSLRSLNKLSNQNKITKGITLKISYKQTSPVSSRGSKSNVGLITVKNKPQFQWPIKTVIDFRNDGLNGVKSIGIIITGKPGSTVLSSASGTVRKIGRMRGFGNYIVITHLGRYSTVYSNLDIIMVSPGETVPAGNAIGKMSSSEQKMHFQIDREGKPENPLQYLPKKI